MESLSQAPDLNPARTVGNTIPLWRLAGSTCAVQLSVSPPQKPPPQLEESLGLRSESGPSTQLNRRDVQSCQLHHVSMFTWDREFPIAQRQLQSPAKRSSIIATEPESLCMCRSSTAQYTHTSKAPEVEFGTTRFNCFLRHTIEQKPILQGFTLLSRHTQRDWGINMSQSQLCLQRPGNF